MAVINDFKSIYEAAQTWRDKCLAGDGSLFGTEQLWTLQNLSELKRLYVDRPDDSKRSFMDKLKDQLADGSPEAKRLAAELFWPMLLFSASQKPPTKIIKMRLVWQWSGAVFPEDIEALDSSLLTGIGSTGPAFQNQFWREYAYAIQLFLAIKSKPQAERMVLLSDGWSFAAFMDGLDESHGRQLYHMLAHLLFPDRFERMASRTHKALIIAHFGNAPSVTGWRDRLDTDKALRDVRAKLGPDYGKDFDYYGTKALRDAWYPVSDDAVDPESGSLVSTPAALPERYSGARFWVIGTGANGSFWEMFRASSYIALGFDDYGQDIGSATYAEIFERLSALGDGDHKPTNGALALYQFASEMRVGDYVFAKQGRSALLGFGRVTSGYIYEQGAHGTSHRRSVEWLKTGSWQLMPEHRITTKSLTDFTRYADWLAYALGLIGEMECIEATAVSELSAPYAASTRTYGLDDLLAEGAFMSRDEIADVLVAWNDKANLILAGAPGTGKSWLAARLAWIKLGSSDGQRLLRIQFHQSYAYEDFVRGWKPGAGSFELKDGPFLWFCEQARADPDKPYVVLIEEINRGDISRVFGELFFLIEKDKRDSNYAVRLSCAKDGEAPFFVPPNLYLIGTMNTADRSIAVVDYALRRRFAVVRLQPAFDREAFSDYMASETIGASTELIATIVESMTALNADIRNDTNLGSGYEIGHSYFTSASGDSDDVDVDEVWFRSIVQTQIMPTLEEYWFDQQDKVERWRKQLIP